MSIKRNWCTPTLLDKDTLMTEDNTFMNKTLVKEECKCINKHICLQIIDLLENKKPDEAMRLLDTMNESLLNTIK